MHIITFYREADVTKERIEKILKAGANVVLTTKGIDDMSLKVGYKYFWKNNTQYISRNMLNFNDFLLHKLSILWKLVPLL